MLYIKYEAEFFDVNCNTVEIPNPDRQVHKDERAKALAAGRADGLKDNEISYNAPMVDADFADVIVWFANNSPWERDDEGKPVQATPEEMGNALDVIRAFQKPHNGYVKLNESALTWLVDNFKAHGAKAFTGVIPALILERLGDVEEGLPPEYEGPSLVQSVPEEENDSGE